MSDFFNEALKGGLDSLTADQLEELIIMAQAKRSESKNNKEVYAPNSCPHCGSIAIKKHGTSAKGTPREICYLFRNSQMVHSDTSFGNKLRLPVQCICQAKVDT